MSGRTFGLLLLCLPADAAVSRSVIVIPESADRQRQQSAKDLQFYIRESTGAEMPIRSERADSLAIHVGRSPYVDRLPLKLDELDEDGFVLKGIDEHNYVIAGPTEHGTEFGVYEFCERYLGVRWLLPGEVGTDIPRGTSLKVPPDEVRQEPAYISRWGSGLNGPIQEEWGRHLRMRSRFEFHHNLYRVFPPSRYVTLHPEFFPMVKGRRYFPTDKNDQNWQPNFSAPALVDEAVKNIKDYFRRNQDKNSFSLGINDGNRFDESPESLARENPQPNYLGRRNVSNSYYRWCNEVVEKVLEEYPDKYFGCLAYSQVADPPSGFKLHPRIIPYSTYERLRWCDPQLKKIGHDLTERWRRAGTILGWYDYAWGQCYCVPRMYPHLMAEYLKYGYENGVRAHYAELSANWGEGPKPYIYFKLQWDPMLDVDVLLDEWYTRCVGPDAAPLLKSYYEIWERFWTKDIQQSQWWDKTGQYLDDLDVSYLADVKVEDLQRSRELLDACVAKTQTDAQRKRAELLRSAFDYYEASALAYRPKILARTRPLRTEADALAAIDELSEALKAHDRRIAWVRQHYRHPILDQPNGIDRYPRLRSDAWHADLLWRLFDWVRQSPAVRQKLEQLNEFRLPALAENIDALLAIIDGRAKLCSANPSYEADLDSWKQRFDAKPGTLSISKDRGHTGEQSLLLEGVQYAGPWQHVPIQAGPHIAMVFAFVPEGQPSGALIGLTAQPHATNKAFWIPNLEVTVVPGEWNLIVYPVTMPDRMEGYPITQVFLYAYAKNLGPGRRVYFDDVALYRLPAPMAQALRP